ncbi:MAG: alpha/beta hydrolase [Gammaproteobacteria bacterium]|nr:alpha/beta hydrolase [Gammaproteobacteria bacterium]
MDSDGVSLYYEACGEGHPVVFVHEMAGDVRSWAPQMRYFSRRYRCIAFNARGYPPSEVPEDPGAYSQEQAADDIANVMRGLELDRAHVVGLSMGSFAALHFGLRHPEMAVSLVVAGCGHGSARAVQARFREDAERLAERVEADGMEAAAAAYALNASRVQFQAKDPRGWARWRDEFAEHSAKGTAMTLRNVQGKRPSLLDLEADIAALEVPVLLIAGDEDDPALDVTLWLKRTLPAAGLTLFAKTGHTVNLEEPDLFNRALQDYFWRVEANAWGMRDPRSLAKSTMFPEQGSDT